MKVHLFSQGKSGCSKAIASLHSALVWRGWGRWRSWRSGPCRGSCRRPDAGADHPGGVGASGAGKTGEQRPPQCREAQRQVSQGSSQTKCSSDGGAGARGGGGGGRLLAGVGEGPALVPEEGGQPRVGGDRRVGGSTWRCSQWARTLRIRKWAIPRWVETRGIGAGSADVGIGGVAGRIYDI